jgi:SAM-dependent methyltransferase
MTPSTIDPALLAVLRCPKSGEPLKLAGENLTSSISGLTYPFERGVPNLMQAPDRFKIDLPWYEPWSELDALRFEKPTRHPASDLPYHLDAHLASVPGDAGDGRWILEVGCGERKCEPYFSKRGFKYVGTDADHRGVGPHLKTDAHNLPFVDQVFDLYFSLAVYEHLASPLQAALEAHRILKPGGTMFGTAAFVYGFHDRASFHHMTHAGLLWTLRMAGFTDIRIWPDWRYTSAIPEMAFGTGSQGAMWRLAARGLLNVLDSSFVAVSQLARRVTGKKPLDTAAREVYNASSITYVATKPR